MKTNLLLIGSLLVFAGCTSTTVTTPQWQVRRVSFLQKVALPSVSISTNGTAQLSGYSSDGGTEAAATITAAAVRAAIKSAAP